jgi:hypothetical protein
MGAGCPFITCAVKKKGIEFCTDCAEGETCERWKGHRLFSQLHDTFVCYQKLEDNIRFIRSHGLQAFEEEQEKREKLLEMMLSRFDDGRSKSFYCIAATVMELEEIRQVLARAEASSSGMTTKDKAKVMRRVLEDVARSKNYYLSLRK